MVELRKRKAPAEPALPPPSKKNSNPVQKAVDKAKEAVKGTSTNASNGTGRVGVGDVVTLDGFGGEIETHNGEKTTLLKLVEQSRNGVVLFTYPKASTPGCTTQACFFRDNHSSVTEPSIGLSIYGLSTDSPKSNTTFATRQSLPYPLLCDPSATLISAIGMKKGPKGTSRGVVIIDKQGSIKVWEQAGPQRTVDAVMAYVQGAGNEKTDDSTAAPAPASTTAPLEAPSTMDKPPIAEPGRAEEVKTAETAAEVSETAAKIDSADEIKVS